MTGCVGIIAASYETSIRVDLSGERFRRAFQEAASSSEATILGFVVEAASDERAILRFPVSFRSWGERLTVERMAGEIRIFSRCSFPLQIFDWGKNRKNADAVRAILLRELARSA